MIAKLAPSRAYAGVRGAIKRVKAREQQLIAWKNMLGERNVMRTRIALGVVDALRIGAFLLVVWETVRVTESATPVAIAIMAAAWLVLSAVHLALRDAILARAFATMTPTRSTSMTTSTSTSTSTSMSMSSSSAAMVMDGPRTSTASSTSSGPPRVLPLSAGAQAALRRVQAPRKPKVRPKPAIVLADREAVDFDDAMSGPVRASGASSRSGASSTSSTSSTSSRSSTSSTSSTSSERTARDFDDA